MTRIAPGLTVLLAFAGFSSLAAQRPEIGFAVGQGLVGGAASRTLITVGGVVTTGADLPGWHFRAYAEWPIAAKLAFRAEVFGNWLSSGSNTMVIAQDAAVKPVDTDRTLGLLGTFALAPFRIGPVTPHFILGVGAFQSHLGLTATSPEVQPAIRARYDGMGLGVQTGLGLEVPIAVGSLWLEWRYAQAFDPTRGVAFMPLTLGFSL